MLYGMATRNYISRKKKKKSRYSLISALEKYSLNIIFIYAWG